jgi:hypothetical protein
MQGKRGFIIFYRSKHFGLMFYSKQNILRMLANWLCEVFKKNKYDNIMLSGDNIKVAATVTFDKIS